MNAKRKMNLLNIILLIFIIILKYIFIERLIDYYELFNALFWIIYAFIVYKIIGYQKGSTNIKDSISSIVVIFILAFVLISNLSGLYFGFLKNPYSLTPINILRNSYSTVLMVICEELIRYMFARKCELQNKMPLYIYTLLIILLDVVLEYGKGTSMSNEALFILITTTMLPSIARNILGTYLTSHVGVTPTLVLRVFYGIYPYVLPIFPDYGNYIISMLGLLIPFLIYIFTKKVIMDYERTRRTPRIKKIKWYFNIPFIAIILFVMVLVSGLFKYQIIAIGSGSMEPVIKYGDAIIFEHTRKSREKEDYIKEGMVIVFKHDREIITHRVLKITNKNGAYIYETKGDNNDTKDAYTVKEEDVIGIVKYKIRALGFPTLWFKELLSK